MKRIVRLDTAEGEKEYELAQAYDLSIPLMGKGERLGAWYIDPPRIEPYKDGDLVGAVRKGFSTNFNTLRFNPHAHVTHTECLGHITEEVHSVNRLFPLPLLSCLVLSIRPEKVDSDQQIQVHQLRSAWEAVTEEGIPIQALVLRTLPNKEEKRKKQYSHTNPPYLTEESAVWIKEQGVDHLLIDLPSVDKEKDAGALKAHRAFWNIPENPRMNSTITEFIFVPDAVVDGHYFLDLQVAPIENDASPSRPVLFKIVN